MEKLENYIDLCKRIDNIVYSNSFFPLSQLKELHYREIDFYFIGLNKESEKKLVAFCPKNYPKDFISFPVKFFKIIKKSKFISLEHKHYLGTILNLGIKREILGDLLVKDDICYGIIIENMFEFLKENLTKINTSPVEVIEVSETDIPESEFKEMSITLPSMRLDSLVAELSNLSRTTAVDYIDLGNVQLNYEIVREKNCKINVGDVIIIKKFGKFIIQEEKGLTKKDKIKILIKKFI